MPIKKKLGRPTDNPKSTSIHVRLDDKCVSILSEYCKQENILRAEAIRQGIISLEDKLNK